MEGQITQKCAQFAPHGALSSLVRNLVELTEALSEPRSAEPHVRLPVDRTTILRDGRSGRAGVGRSRTHQLVVPVVVRLEMDLHRVFVGVGEANLSGLAGLEHVQHGRLLDHQGDLGPAGLLGLLVLEADGGTLLFPVDDEDGVLVLLLVAGLLPVDVGLGLLGGLALGLRLGELEHLLDLELLLEAVPRPRIHLTKVDDLGVTGVTAGSSVDSALSGHRHKQRRNHAKHDCNCQRDELLVHDCTFHWWTDELRTLKSTDCALMSRYYYVVARRQQSIL